MQMSEQFHSIRPNVPKSTNFFFYMLKLAIFLFLLMLCGVRSCIEFRKNVRMRYHSYHPHQGKALQKCREMAARENADLCKLGP